jgi:hypothetical protein
LDAEKDSEKDWFVVSFHARRKSAARTWSRNGAGGGAGFGFTTAGGAVSADFAALRAAICASRLVALSLASASTNSTGGAVEGDSLVMGKHGPAAAIFQGKSTPRV